jgi:hypothetical protein
MGDPPPRSAREVLTRGQTRSFVVQALDAPRRGIELALPGFEHLAGKPTDETVEAEIEEAPPPIRTSASKRGRGGRSPKPAKSGMPDGVVAPFGRDPIPIIPEAPRLEPIAPPRGKAAGKKSSKKAASKKAVTAKKSAAKKAPAKKTAVKKAPAKKTATKAPAKKTPAKKATTKTLPKKTVVKQPASKKPATAKKSPAKKAPTKKAPAKKTVTKQPASKKPATAKKAPAKKAPAKKAPTKRR